VKALLLSAGLGTRLGDATKTTPKALVKIGTETILSHSLNKLFEAGANEIIVNTHYLSNQIKVYLEKNIHKDKIKVVYEPKLLGTGGTFLSHLDYLASEDFFVMHCDNFFEESLLGVVRKHFESQTESIMTMFTFFTSESENCGVVTLGGKDIVTSFREKDPRALSKLANGAIYIFKPEIRDFLHSLNEPIRDLSTDLLPLLVHRSTAYVSTGYFLDIGTPESLEKAREISGKLHV
jgi:mannose-1-phosphate guanylyltransferase